MVVLFLSGLILLLLLTGCDEREPIYKITPRSVKIDPAFQPYVDQYLRAKGAPLKYPEIQIRFANINDSAYAYCSYGNRTILVNNYSWEGLSEINRLEVIVHELGHCDLDRPHDDDEDENGNPVSIMKAKGFVVASMDDMPAFYNELFHRNVPPTTVAQANTAQEPSEPVPDEPERTIQPTMTSTVTVNGRTVTVSGSNVTITVSGSSITITQE